VEPLTVEAARVLGCLVEKEATVPDAYPLTLNALRSACNQTSSRDPIVDYDDLTIQRCLDSLKAGGWVRFVHPAHGERATRFRHVAEEHLAIDAGSSVLLAILVLRGPQTAGELRTRSERAHRFESPAEVEALLAAMASREEPLVLELPRQTGQHGTRWVHLLCGPVDVAALSSATPVGRSSGSSGALADRVAILEAELAGVRARLASLEEALGVDAPDVNPAVPPSMSSWSDPPSTD
jgi:uncharacterized protein YceH (UPF0502 family)